MEFCGKCGGIIKVEANKAFCVSCGRKLSKKPKIEISEKNEQKNIVEIIREEAANIHPTVDMECPKCKNKKSHFWAMQTRSSDESETKFYRCTKCKHTWRKYR